jgi:hypothetical protein
MTEHPDPDLELLAQSLAELSSSLRGAALAAGQAAGSIHRRRHTDHDGPSPSTPDEVNEAETCAHTRRTVNGVCPVCGEDVGEFAPDEVNEEDS